MKVEGKVVCKLCGKPIEDGVLAHYGREHRDAFSTFPNPLADLVFKEG